MSKFFLRIYDYLTAHRKATAVLLVILVAGMAVLSMRLSYEEDIAKFLPKNEKIAKYQELYQKLSSQRRIALILSAADSTTTLSEDTLEMAAEDIAEGIRSRMRVDNLQLTIDETRADSAVSFIYENIPYFLTDSDYARMDSLLSDPSFIRQKMTENRQLLTTPMGNYLMGTLTYDPLGLFSPVLKRLGSLKLSDGYTVSNGYLFTKDGKNLIITFDSPYGNSETRQNTLLINTLDSLVNQLQLKYPQVRATAIGGPVIAVGNASQIKHDSVLTIFFALTAILLILLWHYRRLSDILWIMLSLAFGFLFALAGLSLVKHSVSIIVLGVGSVIIGIAVNYPLHFLDHLREVPDRRQALREMVPPLLIGNITTVAAFLCLIWLDAQAMRDLGLFGALMLVGTILFVLIILPLWTKPSTKPAHVIGSDNMRLPRIPHLLPVVILLTVVLGYFSLRTSFDTDLNHINYMTEAQRASMKLISSGMPEDPVYVVSEGQDLDEAISRNEETMSRLKASHTVSDVRGPGDFLVSQKEQQSRIDRWNRFKSHYLKVMLPAYSDARRQLGFSANAFNGFDDILNRDYEVRPQQYFTPLASLFSEHYLIHDQGKVKIVNYAYGSHQSIKNSVSTAFDGKDLSSQLVSVLNDSFNYVGFVCGFVVFFFLWLSFGSIELALLSFLPLAVSWVWILGIMQLLGVSFNIVNIILATFIFGQGDDYTIFITEGLAYEYATGKRRLSSYKHSVLLSALLMFIGMGCLVFAKHPALRSLGEVTVIGMFTVVLMANYLPPLIFNWLTRKKGKLREVPVTLSRLIYSLYALIVLVVFMYLFMIPFTWIWFHIGKVDEKRRTRYHEFIMHIAHFTIRHIPGVHYSACNRSGEDFKKPAVIICNHQSHLDLMCLLQLTPKMVFLTNDWVWRNHLYGYIIHKAEYYPVSDGIEKNLKRLTELYQRGYSICIFPEGTRSEDCSILRFHKGAFLLAQHLGADLLPIIIHGVGHVLPKLDFMLRRGSVYMEINERIPASEFDKFEGDDNDKVRLMSHRLHKYYKTRYAEICEELETEAYYEPYRRYRRRYQGEYAIDDGHE